MPRRALGEQRITQPDSRRQGRGHLALQEAGPWPSQERASGQGGRPGCALFQGRHQVVGGSAGFRPHLEREPTMFDEPGLGRGGLHQPASHKVRSSPGPRPPPRQHETFSRESSRARCCALRGSPGTALGRRREWHSWHSTG